MMSIRYSLCHVYYLVSADCFLLQLALKVLEACTQSVKMHYEKEKLSTEQAPLVVNATASASQSSTMRSEWTSWAFEGIAKSIETVTSEEKDRINSTSAPLSVVLGSQSQAPCHKSDGLEKVEWEDCDDLDLEDVISVTDLSEKSAKESSSTDRRRKKTKSDSNQANIRKLALDPSDMEAWDDF